MIQEYVLCFAMRLSREPGGDPQFIVQLKQRPDWQKGRWNLPGGKCEQDEPPIVCAGREFYEETGIDTHERSWVRHGMLYGPDFQVHFCKTHLNYGLDYQALFAKYESDERLMWVDYDDFNHLPLVSGNLRIAVPMMLVGECFNIVAAEDFKPNSSFLVTPIPAGE